MRAGILSIAVLFFGTACVAKVDKSADTLAVDSTTTEPTPIEAAPPGRVVTPPPAVGTTPQTGAPTPDTSSPSGGTSFRIAANSFGPLRVGMTVAEAAKAMGGGFGAPKGYSGGCGYAVLTKAPAGLAVMLQDGKIARFEVRNGGIRTAAGARIGDSESRVNSLYPGAVTTPHKYVQGGHYLTVTGPGGNKIIFETDGKKVTEYRSGKSPEVEQVERCG